MKQIKHECHFNCAIYLFFDSKNNKNKINNKKKNVQTCSVLIIN